MSNKKKVTCAIDGEICKDKNRNCRACDRAPFCSFTKKVRCARIGAKRCAGCPHSPVASKPTTKRGTRQHAVDVPVARNMGKQFKRDANPIVRPQPPRKKTMCRLNPSAMCPTGNQSGCENCNSAPACVFGEDATPTKRCLRAPNNFGVPSCEGCQFLPLEEATALAKCHIPA